ncbi:MAG: EscU/YscU/HrcU family type III secretion system export apparatus switch protein [Phycisphaeraceae bacterium]|nr:EscU/YscU/HrcU family type III secretion system export apparatus switch protein [Phycisphaeraceae bacterium]
MREDLGERTIEPTAKRLQDARERGDVARSAEATGAVVLVAVVAASMVLVPFAWEGGLRMIRSLLDPASVVVASTEPGAALLGGARWLLMLGLPLALVPVVAAFLAGLAQVGFRATPSRVAPDPTRLDPIKGFKRIFGLDSVVKFVLDTAKVLLVLGAAGWAAWSAAEVIVTLPALESGAAFLRLARLALTVAAITAGVVALLALLDWWWQHHRWRGRLRMTREELKDELRQSEGDPEMRLRRRQMARQIAMHRMTDAVPRSDVIVTNPEHISVALAYRPGRDRAPIVTAMGSDELALRIRMLAQKHGVPIIERRSLARALWKDADIGREVPPTLWKAVAEVLAFVHRLKGQVAT